MLEPGTASLSQNESDTEIAPLITIDGPAGVGKSTIARRLAKALGWRALETGATYRATACAALAADLDLDDPEALAQLAGELDLTICDSENGPRVKIDGKDVTEALRGPDVGAAVARVARHEGVRHAMIGLQRRLASAGPTVAEGRDMGMTVFPQAPLKFFLTASLAERIERRRRQLSSGPNPADSEAIEREIVERDRLDRQRPVGALRIARDAIVLDSTGMDMEQELRILLAFAGQKPWAV